MSSQIRKYTSRRNPDDDNDYDDKTSGDVSEETVESRTLKFNPSSVRDVSRPSRSSIPPIAVQPTRNERGRVRFPEVKAPDVTLRNRATVPLGQFPKNESPKMEAVVTEEKEIGDLGEEMAEFVKVGKSPVSPKLQNVASSTSPSSPKSVSPAKLTPLRRFNPDDNDDLPSPAHPRSKSPGSKSPGDRLRNLGNTAFSNRALSDKSEKKSIGLNEAIAKASVSAKPNTPEIETERLTKVSSPIETTKNNRD